MDVLEQADLGGGLSYLPGAGATWKANFLQDFHDKSFQTAIEFGRSSAVYDAADPAKIDSE